MMLRVCLVERSTDDSLPKMEVTRGLALESLGQELEGRYLRRRHGLEE